MTSRSPFSSRDGFNHTASHEITPHSVYLQRREIIRGLALGAAGLAGVTWAQRQARAQTAKPGVLPSLVGAPSSVAGAMSVDKVTAYKDASSYNNFYEFGYDKADPARLACLDVLEGRLRFQRHEAALCLEKIDRALADVTLPPERRGDALLLDLAEHPEHFGGGLLDLVRIEHRIDAEQPCGGRGIAPCIRAVHDAETLAEAAVKAFLTHEACLDRIFFCINHYAFRQSSRKLFERKQLIGVGESPSICRHFRL